MSNTRKLCWPKERLDAVRLEERRREFLIQTERMVLGDVYNRTEALDEIRLAGRVYMTNNFAGGFRADGAGECLVSEQPNLEYSVIITEAEATA